MDLKLKDRVIVVGGADGGVGQATVRLLQKEGAITVAADRPQVDLADSESVKAFFANLQFPAIHGYVSLVWHGKEEGELLSITPEGLEGQFHNTLFAVIYPCQTAIKLMQKTGGGSIVIVSSVNALLGLGETAYDMCKAALNQLARNIATGYGRYNIRANALCPGTIGGTPSWLERCRKDPGLLKKISDAMPDGKVTTATEMAQVIAFLLSEKSAMFNGATLICDRGWSLTPSMKPRKDHWFD